MSATQQGVHPAVNSSCTRCAKRKAKCNGQDPCSRCTESKALCVYAIARKRGPKRKQAEESNEEKTTTSPQWLSGSNKSGSSLQLSVDALISPILRDHLYDLCHAFVTVSWPIIYMPALPSLHSLAESRPILYSALLLSCTAIESDNVQPSIVSTRQRLLHSFTSQLEGQGGLSCTEPSLPIIQALLFATSYFVGAGKMLVAWNHCGLACRMALAMTLHLSTRSSGKKSRSRMEEQEERRTFWGLYVMEQVVSYLLRLPPLLRAEDVDRELPDVEERDEYELWLNEHPRTFINTNQAKAMTGVRTHALSSLLAWVQVMKEHESIRKDLKRDIPSGTGAFERSYTERSQRLQAFKDQLPAHLQWHSPYLDSSIDCTQFKDFDLSFNLALESHAGVAPQVLLMRAWYSECCILLHRPCVNESNQGSFSARQCLCAATEVCAIVSAYDIAFGIDLMQSGFIHIIFQSATLLAAMESVYQIYGPDFWTPSLPAFPIAVLFERCFNWLRRLSPRFPFANHYLSILASLSKAQSQTWQATSTSNLPRSNVHSDQQSRPLAFPTKSTNEIQPSAPQSTRSYQPPASLQQPPSDLIDDFWDIVPFDVKGDNLNEWLAGIEAFVPI